MIIEIMYLFFGIIVGIALTGLLIKKGYATINKDGSVSIHNKRQKQLREEEE